MLEIMKALAGPKALTKVKVNLMIILHHPLSKSRLSASFIFAYNYYDFRTNNMYYISLQR